MLHYNTIDISEGTDLIKSNRSIECMICHYWFFNHRFKYQDSVCKVLVQTILLLSLLKMLIIVVLFIALANMYQLIY